MPTWCRPPSPAPLQRPWPSLHLQTAVRNTQARNLLWLFRQSILGSTALSSGGSLRLQRARARAGSCFLCSPSFTSIPSRAPQSQSLSGSLWLQLYMCVCDQMCVRACVSLSASVCVRVHVSVFNVKLSLYAYVRV